MTDVQQPARILRAAPTAHLAPTAHPTRHGRVIVVDDDPTGTQTVSGLRVILRPSRAEFDEFFHSTEPAVWVLSNTRALPREEAAALVRTIADAASSAAAAAGETVTVVLRGDSTLRGHVFAETDALDPQAAVLFVPAFLEGGRITREGVHLLATEHGPVPVAQTEFARDPDFGYRSLRLTDWVAEVSGGTHRAVLVSTEQLRRDGADGLASVLLAAGKGDVVIPDVVSSDDLEVIAQALWRAQQDGARVVVRSAASLAAVLTGSRTSPVSSIAVRAPGRVLVVCGSFTEASTRQLHRLGRLWDERVEIETSDAVTRTNDVVERAVRGVSRQLASAGVAVLATQRVRPADAGPAVANAVMDALVATVRAVADDVDAVISKGGITSARVATDGLSANSAVVVGQPLPGVALWRLTRDGRRPHQSSAGLPLVVVPGNVGDDATLTQLLGRLECGPAPVPISCAKKDEG